MVSSIFIFYVYILILVLKKKIIFIDFNYYGTSCFICISSYSNCTELIALFYFLVFFYTHALKITICHFYSKRFVVCNYIITFYIIKSYCNNSITYAVNNIAFISKDKIFIYIFLFFRNINIRRFCKCNKINKKKYTKKINFFFPFFPPSAPVRASV